MSKISINFNFSKNAGGGLSFLSLFKEYLTKNNIYSQNFLFSKYILINSHHQVLLNILIKIFSFNKVFIHRIDGPIQLYDNPKNHRDKLVNLLNQISDFDIYQSKWSQRKNLNLKVTTKKDNKVIYNGSNLTKKKIKSDKSKVQILISSFSSNPNKGFAFFKFLDEKINFQNYDINFYGNTNISFKNIKDNGVIQHQFLIDKINDSDLVIIASKNDPCSNFLIECINNKIDLLALNSGGHVELISNKNCLFSSKNELLEKIINFKKKKYSNKILYPINNACKNYVETILKAKPRKKNIIFELNILFKLITILLKQYIYKLVNFSKNNGAI